MTKSGSANWDASITPEEILSSLERVLASSEFTDSVQLSRFLRYAVENYLAGETGQLKESIIGLNVFRRGPNYDPKSDPIVRVEARRLRARLDAYYEHAGPLDRIKIVLPKGGYAPIFECVQLAVEPAPMTVAPGDLGAELVSLGPAGKGRRWIATLGLLLFCAIAAAAIYRLASAKPLVTRFWSSILQGARPVLLVPSDAGLAMLQDLVHVPVQLRDYITGEYRTRYASDRSLTSVAWTFGERRYTPVADLDFAVTLAKRSEAASRGISTRFARDVRLDDIKGNNLILFGPKHMNPWMELFERDATFRLDHDEANSSYRLVNTKPAAGDIQGAVITLGDVRSEIYGIVNYHRSSQGSSFVLMISGTSVAGAEAAADFVLDDLKLLPVLQKAEKNGRIQGFDVLLHGRNLAGNAPRASVVGLHIEE